MLQNLCQHNNQRVYNRFRVVLEVLWLVNHIRLGINLLSWLVAKPYGLML